MIKEESFDGIGAWLSDWTYETDVLLSHVSGLKVVFYDPAHDPCSPDGLRSKCKGDFVDGSVRASRAFFLTKEIFEIDAVKSTMKLYQQAELLYRHRPAGASNAPARQNGNSSWPDA